MAITTYLELQSAIARWLARDDLTANIPDFITLFEAAANRRLRVRQQEATATLTPTAGVATLPADYLAWRRVTWTGSPTRTLEYVTPTYLNWQYNVPFSSIAQPGVFTIEGSLLTVAPIDSTALTFEYFQSIPPLSTTLNWLFTSAPDAYLFGSLYHAYEFMLDLEKAAFRKAQRDEVLNEIETISNKTRGVGGMRILGPTP
jgi:hypothetical protein